MTMFENIPEENATLCLIMLVVVGIVFLAFAVYGFLSELKSKQ